MRFKILPISTFPPSSPTNRMYLIRDNWDDWFKYSTLFSLVYIDLQGARRKIGAVKIGEFNMEKDQRSPNIAETFVNIGKKFFSLGQDASYYEHLTEIGDAFRDEVLSGLNDLAKNQELFSRAANEHVTKISLLRDVSPTSVKGQFRRLAAGGVSLSQYDFTYTAPKISGFSAPPMTLYFHVEPESNPPTNIHVLIGRNGVGKTHLLNNMITALIDEAVSPSKVGKFTADIGDDQIFASLVSVTFSAFDDTDPFPERRDKTKGIKYSYIGLKRLVTKSSEVKYTPKSPTVLKNEFIKSVEACKLSGKTDRWKRSLQMLEADPNFKEAEVAGIADILENDEFEATTGKLFYRLSSGHKIVLLTITRLIETVEERTLVLIDEPEAHLHPPLLSAFIRVLSDLLIQKNGVAIIATHSPVVLQEVPQKCVWKLRRSLAAKHWWKDQKLKPLEKM